MTNGEIHKLETEAKAAGKSTLVIICEMTAEDDLRCLPVVRQGVVEYLMPNLMAEIKQIDTVIADATLFDVNDRKHVDRILDSLRELCRSSQLMVVGL